jgi:phthalate 4,5-dioxygenase oxygenase subunit
MMMTAEENDLLCRVEGNAPMGQLMRRHWIPALLCEELPQPDGDPVPVRLFGEDLVAFRDTDGQVGLIDRYCPHRRASLEFGRNEEGGLRCLYHGWKLNVSGDVIEMPSEPAAAAAAAKVKHKSYPTHEHGGFVWAYMGPPETMPPFQPPPFAPTADTKVSVVKVKIDCNWAQVLEGAIDSAHSSTLHSTDITPGRVGGATQPKNGVFLRPTTDKAPRIQVQPTEYGFKYAAIRRPIQNADTLDYVRMTVFVAPFTVLVPPNSKYSLFNVNVPIDDTHTMFHFLACSERSDGAPDQEEFRRQLRGQVGIDVDKRWVKIRNLDNNYLQDRQAMRTGSSFTGIQGFPNQDIAMWETMGPIADRSIERLGASDQAIVAFRRSMVEAAARFRDAGEALGAADAGTSHHTQIRAFEGMLPKGQEWRHLDTEQAQQEHRARAESTVR